MCELQKYEYKNPLPICKYTKNPCTLCVWGNMKTYHEAEKALKKRGEDNA